jgi:hypothetical protein
VARRQRERLARAGRGVRASWSDTRAASQAFERTHTHRAYGENILSLTVCYAEGLKALFRPITVFLPEIVLICENILMAEGFEEAKDLAIKVR